MPADPVAARLASRRTILAVAEKDLAKLRARQAGVKDAITGVLLDRHITATELQIGEILAEITKLEAPHA